MEERQPVPAALWVSELTNVEASQETQATLLEQGVPFSVLSVEVYNPTDITPRETPVLITGHGVFRGPEAIASYARNGYPLLS